MLRQFFTLKRLGMLVVAALFAWGAVELGQWQLGRHEDKVAARTAVETHYSADPIALHEAFVEPDRAFESEAEWTRVEATGTYLTTDQLLVRNRPFRGTYGYEVLIPFQDSASEDVILVDRGWVENAETAATLPEVPDAPTDEVRIQGWLRSPEIDLDRDLPETQLASMNVESAREKTGLALLPAYLELETENTSNGQVPPRPEAADAPDTGLGPHLAYAIQWWLVVPLGFILIAIFFRREVLDAREAESPRPPKERKKRIWDEEDE